MRLVPAAAELPDALRSAGSEAAKAFGDGRLILERALVEPRHVEIQVLADAHGHVIHLGERDCSVQRRHQKVVEEAPSPAVDGSLRARMGATAVAVAREIGYVGAGTVEFLLDRAGHFYFMEMNTRLQVEHPVTELVTGLDLVELQIRVARGEPLPLQQADVELRGHAVEVRLCAESPADEFLPGSGPVIDWAAPAGVRCDHALATGWEVTAWYDSMVAKLVAHAATREQALARLAEALDHTVLLGLQSNREFLARVLRHPAFVAGGDVSTAFIGRNFPTAASRAGEPDARIWALAAWLSVAAAPEAFATDAGWRHWTNGRALPMPWRLRRAGNPGAEEQHGKIFVTRTHAVVETVATRHEIIAYGAAPGSNARAVVDGQSIEYRYGWNGDTLWLHTPSADHAFFSRRREPVRSTEAEGERATTVHATINARVLQVCVAAGAEVAQGDRLVVLEAMKMEHEVRAARPGRIAEVGAKVGDQVVPGQALVRYAGEA